MTPRLKRRVQVASRGFVVLSALIALSLVGLAWNDRIVPFPDEPVVDFASDPNWTSSNSVSDGNDFGWIATSYAGGVIAGEIGGTVARTNNLDRFYADTHLSQTLNLNDTVSASGRFAIRNITEGWGRGQEGNGDSACFVGHFSTHSATNEFMGLEFRESGPGQMRVRVRFQRAGGIEANSAFVTVAATDPHTFRYAYQPGRGREGRLSSIIDGEFLAVDLNNADRISGSRLDAFGMGITNSENSESDPAKTAQIFFDNLSYSGFRARPSGPELPQMKR